jgi:hypothetical protein
VQKNDNCLKEDLAQSGYKRDMKWEFFNQPFTFMATNSKENIEI